MARLQSLFVWAVCLVAGSMASAAAQQAGGAVQKMATVNRGTIERTMNEQSIALSGRVRLAYVEQGNPAGVPVVMLHGYTDSWRSFARVLPHLPASLHVFALSQRGHGASERPVGGYHPKDFSDDVAAFLEARRLGPAIIVGHSMGSTIAQRFAIDHPERTLGLVLVGTATTWLGNPGVQELWGAVSQLADPIDPEFVRAFQESTLVQPVPSAYVDTVVNESLRVPARVWQAVLGQLMQASFSGELRTIAAPTLIVWGDRDGLVGRAEQDKLASTIPGARLFVYRGAGHGVHWEEPERFATDVDVFTTRILSQQRGTARSAR